MNKIKSWLRKLRMRRISEKIANYAADNLERYCDEIIERVMVEIKNG